MVIETILLEIPSKLTMVTEIVTGIFFTYLACTGYQVPDIKSLYFPQNVILPKTNLWLRP